MNAGPAWRRRMAVGVLIAMVSGVGIDLGSVASDAGPASPHISTSNPVQPVSLRVPTAIAALPLFNERGQAVDLASFHRHVVVLADFMTSCQEECPITTGALMAVQAALADDHLSRKVLIVETTVDPWRDSPNRLEAYAQRFGVHWSLLTGSPRTIARLWSFFGVYYKRVKEGTPPDINWETGRPYTFDIVHTDVVYVLGPEGSVRAVVEANANVGGKLSQPLRSLLDPEGIQDLVDPGLGSWTTGNMLQAIGAIVGRSIPTPREER